MAGASVAVIGGGISGLMAAQALTRSGILATVFDTGKHGVGGRMSSRMSEPLPSSPAERPLKFDHAAQCFSATDPRFRAIVEGWVKAGVAQRWQGIVGTVGEDGALDQIDDDIYVGAQGRMMSGIPQHVASMCHAVKAGAWVGKMVRSDVPGAGWSLFDNRQKHLGDYQGVIIAHNGKCAARLTSGCGIDAINRGLATKFGARPLAQLAREKQLVLSSIWSVTVVFKSPLPIPCDGVFFPGSSIIAWAGNNGSKNGGGSTAADDCCWTLQSTATFGRDHKCPQEAVPPAKAAEVALLLLTELYLLLALPPPSPCPDGSSAALPSDGSVLFWRAQLWGAGLPLNTAGVDCLLDVGAKVGACGDWCREPSVQGAALSGIALADQMARLLAGKPVPEATTACTWRPFVSDIGVFSHNKDAASTPIPDRARGEAAEGGRRRDGGRGGRGGRGRGNEGGRGSASTSERGGRGRGGGQTKSGQDEGVLGSQSQGRGRRSHQPGRAGGQRK